MMITGLCRCATNSTQKLLCYRQHQIAPFLLHGRKYLEVDGIDTKKFLQGLLSNDIYSLTEFGQSLACGMLNPKVMTLIFTVYIFSYVQGRMVSDVMVYNLAHSNEGSQKLLLEVHAKHASEILRYLTIYKLRSAVKIAQSQYQTLVVPSDTNGAGTVEAVKAAYPAAVLATADPRVPTLASRLLFTPDSAAGTDEEEHWAHVRSNEAFRFLHGLAEGSELEGRIPLECNLDLLNYICFNKGCYIGQELTARTKYKGVVRKRIVPFLLDLGSANTSQTADPFNPHPFSLLTEQEVSTVLDRKASDGQEMTHDILEGKKVYRAGQDDKYVGTVVSVSRNLPLGLALMTLGELQPECDADSSEEPQHLEIFSCVRGANQAISIRPFRPLWWVDNDPITGKPVMAK